jgi:hypothetical protein
MGKAVKYAVIAGTLGGVVAVVRSMRVTEEAPE